MVRLALIFSAVFLFLPTSVSAENLMAHECPSGKFLFEEKPIQKIRGYDALYASLLIRGEGLKTETYLFTREDGWAHLSSEKTVIMPLQTVSNCLPAGQYDVRVEYYTKFQYIGYWFLGALEYRVQLDHAIFPDEAAFISGTTGIYRSIGLYSNLRMHWPFFAFFIISIALLAATAVVFIRFIRIIRSIIKK